MIKRCLLLLVVGWIYWKRPSIVSSSFLRNLRYTIDSWLHSSKTRSTCSVPWCFSWISIGQVPSTSTCNSTITTIIRGGVTSGSWLTDTLVRNGIGMWKNSGKVQNVVIGGRMLGIRQVYKFFFNDPATNKLSKRKTGWAMVEYARPLPEAPHGPDDTEGGR